MRHHAEHPHHRQSDADGQATQQRGMLLARVRFIAFMIGYFLPTILSMPGVLSSRYTLPSSAVRALACHWTRSRLFTTRLFSGSKMLIKGDRSFSPSIIAMNHESIWDVVMGMGLFPRDSIFIARASLMKIPVLGWYFDRLGVIAIDRHMGVTAVRALTQRAQAAIKSGSHVIVFPQGTRSHPQDRSRMKHAGLRALVKATQAPVVSVIHDSAQLMPHRKHTLPSNILPLMTTQDVHWVILPPLSAHITHKDVGAQVEKEIYHIRDLISQQNWDLNPHNVVSDLRKGMSKEG